jgi:spore coat protein U-like protein
VRYHRSLIRLAICSALLLLVPARRADAAGCSVSTTPVVFGTYNVFAASPVDTVGQVVYRCTGNNDYVVIAITKGLSNAFSARQMGSGTERLAYNLFKDAARTQVWGDLTGGTGVYYDLDPPKNRDVSVPVYGRVPAGQDVSAGSYGDTVTVVVFF